MFATSGPALFGHAGNIDKSDERGEETVASSLKAEKFLSPDAGDEAEVVPSQRTRATVQRNAPPEVRDDSSSQAASQGNEPLGTAGEDPEKFLSPDAGDEAEVVPSQRTRATVQRNAPPEVRIDSSSQASSQGNELLGTTGEDPNRSDESAGEEHPGIASASVEEPNNNLNRKLEDNQQPSSCNRSLSPGITRQNIQGSGMNLDSEEKIGKASRSRDAPEAAGGESETPSGKNNEDPTILAGRNSEDEIDDEEDVSLDLEEPSPEVMEYARRELGETDEVKCLTLQELRDMIYERGECTPHRMDDAFLIRFLRARNFNVNRAHRLVVNYCNFKDEHPAIHQDVNPLQMRHIGDDDVMTVPAYRTQCGRRMMIYRMRNWDPRKYSVEEIFKATVIVLELGILEPRAQVLGGIVIFDLEGLTMAHAWSVTPQVAAMVLSLMVSAFPMKSQAIHILHQSWVFDAIFAVFKPLLDSRMKDKIHFHGNDMESLHSHVAPTSLPRIYGGTRNELPYYKWIDSLTRNPTIVKEMHQLGYVIPEELLKSM